jgi:tetratricopeptide (TPR) repeat protein
MDQIGLAIWGWVSAGTLVGLSRHVNQEKLQSSDSTNDNSEGIKLKPISVILGATIFLMPSVYYFPVLKNESNLYFAIRNIPILIDDVSKVKNFDRIIKEGYKAKQLELRLTTVRYLGASNKVNEAILLAEFSAKQEPRSFSAWHLVAGLYEISGRYKEAVPAREKTIQLDPHNKIVKDLLRSIK